VTDAELAALADEIAARIRARGQGGRSRGAAGSAAGSPAPAAVAHRAPVRSPTASVVRVADLIDHTLLKAEATREEIVRLCAEAREHHFAAVCVNPQWVSLCASELEGTDVDVATVVGFPLGATTTRAKAAEAAEAVDNGAQEVDMVVAVGRIRGGDWAFVEDDIAAVVRASRPALVKVIIESALLGPHDIIRASVIAKEAGAHFVKTSTGFHPAGGASAEAVRLMRLAVGSELGVKASGGVRDCATALAMMAAGANRIGTSSGVGMAGCLGDAPLVDLLEDPAGHAHRCTGGSCGGVASNQPY
jgi:deoxyribose-phosphate aldolase